MNIWDAKKHYSSHHMYQYNEDGFLFQFWFYRANSIDTYTFKQRELSINSFYLFSCKLVIRKTVARVEKLILKLIVLIKTSITVLLSFWRCKIALKLKLKHITGSNWSRYETQPCFFSSSYISIRWRRLSIKKDISLEKR